MNEKLNKTRYNKPFSLSGRRILLPLSLVLFSIIYWFYHGLIGVNPTDDGFILGLSWRLVNGEIPHVDFTSPRPALSAYLHLPEALLPFGNLAISHLVTSFQMMWIAFVSVKLVFRNGVNDFQIVLLTVFVFILNVGMWPLMAWHTIDGLTIAMSAIWFVELSRWKWSVQVAWLISGLAPLVKQGFLLVPIALAFWFLITGVKTPLIWSWLVVVFPILYLVFTAGSIDVLISQLHSGSIAELVRPIYLLGKYSISIPGLMSLLLSILLILLSKKLKSLKSRIFISTVFISAVIVSGLWEKFAMGGTWVHFSVIALIVFSLAGARDRRSIALVMLYLTLAFSISMSWGAPTPVLFAGSISILALYFLLGKPKDELEGISKSKLFTWIIVVIDLFSILTLSQLRDQNIYADLPRGEQTKSSNLPFFFGMHMSSQMNDYLENLDQCIQNHPSKSVLIYPDGVFLYPAFGLHNPFYLDWWWTPEEPKNQDQKLRSSVDQLNKSSSWLVLFQSYSMFDLSKKTEYEVNKNGTPFAYNTSDLKIFEKLDGQIISCGSLTGVYRP